MSFWGELRRRNVVRVGIAYAAVGWLVVQMATSVEGPLSLPGWFDTMVIVLVLIGFPVALVLAWAFELTPEGVRLTPNAKEAAPVGRRPGRALNYVVIGALGVAVLLLGFDRYRDPAGGGAEPTLAVMAFTADDAQSGFAVGLAEELANTLDEVSGLTVKGTPVSLRGSERDNRELGEVLGVNYLLSGNVISTGENLRVQAQLLRADNGDRLWSDAYDRTIAVDDLFMMMDELVVKVADALQVSLGVGIGERRGMTRDVKAYEAYVRALALSAPAGAPTRAAIDALDTAIRYDDEFALAWAFKAERHNFLALLMSGDASSAQKEASFAAAQRAIEIEPDMGEAHAILAGRDLQNLDWAGAASEFATAWRLSPTPGIASQYAFFQRAIGRFEESEELLRTALSINALDRNARAEMILTLGLQERLAEANAAYQGSLTLFEDQDTNFNEFWFITLSRLGSTDTTTNTDPVRGLNGGDGIYPFAEEHIDAPAEAIAGIKEMYGALESPSVASTTAAILWLAYFGDTQTTQALLESIVRRGPIALYYAWIPAMKGVRQTAAFRQFLREIGLVDYWNETGWPDICQPTADDFSCN